MSHNSRIRTPGTWTGSFLPSEFTTLDANLAAAVNGDDGGVWAPSSLLTIGGLGLSVTGPTYFGQLDSLTMSSGTMTLAGQLNVFGTFQVLSSGLVTLNGGSHNWASALSFNVKGLLTFTNTSSLTFTAPGGGLVPSSWSGTPTFNTGFAGTWGNGSVLTFETGTTLQGSTAVTQGASHAATLSCPVTISGTVTQNGPRTQMGPNAAIAWRRTPAQATTSNYDASQDSYNVPNLTGAVNFTIRHSGVGGSVVAATGMRIHFTALHGSGSVNFKREDASVIITIAPPAWVDLYFDGSAWQVEGWEAGGAFTALH